MDRQTRRRIRVIAGDLAAALKSAGSLPPPAAPVLAKELETLGYTDAARLVASTRRTPWP